VPASLPVDLNRGRLHAIEAPGEFTTDGSFHVDLSNHGEGVHVHVHLDDDLSTVAHIGDANVFVAGDTTTTVDVVVEDAPSNPLTGRLKVSTGYGAETTYVDVTIDGGEDEPRQVAVDESLSKPQRRPPQQSPLAAALDTLPGPNVLPFVVFVFLAVLVAVAAIALVGNSPAVLVGVGVVLGGAVAALVFMLR
jgi:hypothetical protein